MTSSGLRVQVTRLLERDGLRRKLQGLEAMLGYARDPLEMLTGLKREHGDIAEIEVLGMPWLLLSDPEDIEYVLVRQAKIMGRDDYVATLERTLGKGLLTSEGELWKRQRKLMAQAFTPRRIKSYAQTMVRVGARGLSWREGEAINVHAETSRLTMEIVAAVLFGASIDARDVELVGEAMEAVNVFYAGSPEAMLKLPEWVPTPLNRRLAESVERLDSLIYGIIAERRKSGERSDDLLSTLLNALDEGGAGMSDQQLRDEAMTLFLAGHETTALMVAHTLYLLSTHPAVERRVVAELDEVIGQETPSIEHVQQLRYMRQVLDESLRLYPPAWVTGREALEDFELRGRQIPKGAQLIMSEWVVHRDPRWFPDPDVFDPERWTAERRKQLPRYAYFPFGGGPRVCIGNHFALLEATLLLALILPQYHLELAPGQRLEFEPSITLRPKGPGLQATVRARAELG